MDKRTIEGPMTEIALRQIEGAKITTMRGVQYFIEFELENDYKVAYVYNINANKDYFLQRVLPYPVRHGKFSSEKELVEFIKKDVAEFRNAEKSSNFENFVKTTSKLQDMIDAMETMFLNHNVDKESLSKIDQGLNRIIQGIEEVSTVAKKIEN